VYPLGRKQVEDLVANLAQMHRTMWEHPDLHALQKTPVEHCCFRQSLQHRSQMALS